MGKGKKVVFVIIAVGISLRLLHWVLPVMDSDQAVTGLMARHILKGEFPIFFWGQIYCGAIEAYLVAIFFAIFGASRYALNIVPVLESIAFMLLMYMMAKRVFGKKVGIFTLLLTAIPARYLVVNTILARANYVENLILGTLVFYLTYQIVYPVRSNPPEANAAPLVRTSNGVFEERGIKSGRLFFLLGLVFGLAWWTNFQSIYFILTSFFFIFLRKKLIFFTPTPKKAPLFKAGMKWNVKNLPQESPVLQNGVWGFTRRFLSLVLGVFIGGSPFWYYCFTHDFSPFKSIGEGKFTNIGLALKYLFVVGFPIILGVIKSEPRTVYLPIVSQSLVAIYIFAFLYILKERFKGLPPHPEGGDKVSSTYKAPPPHQCIGGGGPFFRTGCGGLLYLGRFSLKKSQGIDMFIIFFLIFVVLYTLSGYGIINTQRYMLVLYLCLLIFSAYFLAKLGEKRKILSNFILGMVLLANFHQNIISIDLFNKDKREGFYQERKNNKELFEFLENTGIKYVYVDDYWRSYQYTFDAQEKIIFTEWNPSRYPKYFEGAHQNKNVAFYFPGDETAFDEVLKTIGTKSYKRKFIAGATLYYDFEQLEKNYKEIELVGVEAHSNYEQEKVNLAIDGELTTRWTTEKPQVPGMYFQLDLGRVEEICRLILELDNSPYDYPRGYVLSISLDGKAWKEVVVSRINWGNLTWGRFHPIMNGEETKFEICFEPHLARFIKLTQTGSHEIFWWSIYEIRLYYEKK